MVVSGLSKRIGAGMLVLAAAGLATPLAAQSANDYRLPGATGSPTSRPAGPVDPSDPTISLPRTRPSATPSPEPVTPSPVPSAAASPSGAAVPREIATPRPSPSRTAAPAPAANQPAPTAAAPLPTPTDSTTPPATPSPLPVILPTPQAELAPPPPFDWQPWAAGGAALLAGIGAVLWRRRRPPTEPEMEFEPPVAATPEPEPESVPEPVVVAPVPKPVVAPTPSSPPPQPSLAPTAPELALTLEARRLTASLMATTLSYALRLTNTGTAPIAALAIEADLVSAHSSLPVEQQIASDEHPLELRHAQVTLAPGESVEFTGDLRLPLTEITPIRSGSAAYFVPLARFRVEGGARVLAQTFVIGELPEQPGGALRPFRLDLGPRTYSRVGQRPVA